MSKLIERLSETDSELLEELLEVAFLALNDIGTQKRVASEMQISEDRVNGAAGVLMALKDLNDSNVVDDWMPVKTKSDFEVFIDKVKNGEY